MNKRQKRAQLAKRLQEIHEVCEKEGRSLSAEEQKNWDDCNAEIDRLQGEIDREERMLKIKAGMESGGDPGKKSDVDPDPAASPSPDDELRARKDRTEKAKKEVAAAFTRYLHNEIDEKQFRSLPEVRALQANLNVSGGYLVPPVEFVQELIKQVSDEVFIRGLARVMTLKNSKALVLPVRKNRMADANWTNELQVGSKDTSLNFGQVEFIPHKISKEILVSLELLNNSPMSPESLVMEEFRYIFGITEEKAFITGTGVKQPLGVMVASASGIDTDRDVATGNTSTSITFDGLISALYALKAQYQNMCSWMFHRDALAQIRKLKDSQNRYLWEPSTVAGQPDRILNRPFYMSEFMPNTFTTGQYVGFLAHWNECYRIVDGQDFEMRRLDELYAESDQVAYIGKKYTDARPVKSEAAVRIKLG